MDGAQKQHPSIMVSIHYTDDWDNQEAALNALENMKQNDVDVVYPAGDGFNIEVIQQLKEDGLFAIGYVADQAELGSGTVLTSTVQHAGKVYNWVMERQMNGTLPSGLLSFDFEDDMITLGAFSPEVDQAFKEEILTAVEHYRETGQLEASAVRP
ncbi:BMP family ABC transporter substrate-binding protein [Jeotgalibacillus soli]|uniref:Transcriptional regulator n=1 Tax=Jeotgalibacillus soli TaxID=889306 RepID=A0A0C2VNU1_9BACL|nr:BMP family ABC transporter substrate-binding protein [Jeotgalibacillus soli]KIL45673.1 transcriptional regulator [Jeotgalibacillus soli]